MEPTDRRLAELYDLDNPDGPDHDFFRRVANDLDTVNIVDLGCGTGILTVTLASQGRQIVGIDPDRGMLDVARRRSGTEQVEWLVGDSRQIGDAKADVILMTGNVAQHIGPSDWQRSLADIAAGLRPGGTVCFESRNPAREAWREWPTGGQTTRVTDYGRLTEWLEVTEPDTTGTVILTAHNRWDESGEHLIVTQPLTFRTVNQIRDDLRAVGIVVDHVAGDWTGRAFAATDPIMVITASRT